MLRLEKNQQSTLIVTVSELKTLSNPYWLFEFMHEQSFEKVYCILTNISTGTDRYDEFQLTDGVEVTFPYSGFYTYKIYEQTSSSNLDPDLATSLCEEGRAHVWEPSASDQIYDSTIVNNIYE